MTPSSNATNAQTLGATAAFKRVFEGPEHQPFTVENGEPAALLIHGFLGTPDEMRPVADVLAAQGWSVSTPLLPGFGEDLDTLFDREAGDWLDEVRAGHASIRRDHDPFLLVGYSMGAAIAMVLAEELVPDGLLLISPFWKLPLDNALTRLLSPVLRLVLRKTRPFRRFDLSRADFREGIHIFMPDLDLDDPAIQDEIRNMTVPVSIFEELSDLGKQAFAAAPAVKMPTSIVQGYLDDVARPQYTRQLLAKLNGALRYCQVRSGHDLTRMTSPAWPQVADCVAQFASSIANAGLWRDD